MTPRIIFLNIALSFGSFSIRFCISFTNLTGIFHMAASTIVTDRKRGEDEGYAAGGTRTVTVSDWGRVSVRMVSAQQGSPRSGATSADRAVLWGRMATGSVGRREYGIAAMSGRTAGRCGTGFPHGSGSHGQSAGRTRGVSAPGSGAVAVGDCSTGFVTTSPWGASRPGGRGAHSPLPGPH